MAVTYTILQFLASARIGDTPEERNLAIEKLAYATHEVERYAPLAPEIVANEAVSRLAGYIYDQPTISGGVGFANALRNSGAARILLPYRVHRAGLSSDDISIANAAVGTTGNPVIGLSVAGGQLVITFSDGTTTELDLPSGRGVGLTDIFDLRLPAPAVAMRFGWTFSNVDATEETFLRDGNHPSDGAAEGTTAGLLTPPIPVGMTIDPKDYRFHIWVAGAVDLGGLTGLYGDNWLPEFPRFGELEVDSVDGIVYSERHTRRDTDGLYIFTGIIPGELIATQPWVRTIAGLTPGGVFTGTDQTARDAAETAQERADAAFANAETAQQSANDNDTDISDNADAITALPTPFDWAQVGNSDEIPATKISSTVRGTKVHVNTSFPATGLLGDILILDLTTTSPSIYEWTSNGWHLDYTFQGGRVHVVTAAHDIDVDSPVANGADILFELVGGTLKLYRRLHASSAPFWQYYGEVMGGGGGDGGVDQIARDAAIAAQATADANAVTATAHEANPNIHHTPPEPVASGNTLQKVGTYTVGDVPLNTWVSTGLSPTPTATLVGIQFVDATLSAGGLSDVDDWVIGWCDAARLRSGATTRVNTRPSNQTRVYAIDIAGGEIRFRGHAVDATEALKIAVWEQ